jgi:ATP-dependent Clp protease ATP-binding subunit ClpC
MKVAEAFQRALMDHANLRKMVLSAEGLVLALLEQKDSVAIKILREVALDLNRMRSDLQNKLMNNINELPEFREERVGHLSISQDLKVLFEASDQEKKRLGDTFISTGAIFLGGFNAGVSGVQKAFHEVGLHYEECAKAYDMIRGHSKISDREDENRQSVMEEYTTDLTVMARRGQLDPVLCRDREIEQVIQILSRRKKNNPLLIGEPGVGKTVIAEGLANRIVAADVPEYLLNKRVLLLEMGSLLAGAKMQGEFEERLKTIRDEVIASSGDIILFIDEIHTVVGAGRTSGALDASNMLKPALARGQLQCIGATTLREFKQYIESDKALARRFQTVKVNEPSVEDTIQILNGIKPKYEQHHGVVYTGEALRAAAVLSSKYITERFLPDKAIDLLDEAGAVKRLQLIYTPPAMRELEHRKQDLLEKKSQAFNEQDFENMARYQMEISQLESEITKLRENFKSTEKERDCVVEKEEIAKVVAEFTGIPVAKVVAEEAEKLVALEERLGCRVVGQDHAIKSVANAIRRNRSGLKKPGKPIASFLFMGPTGVGKTELAKAIAAEMLDDENRIIRVDMSEYMEKHNVSKLIGSPPGYVGYGEGGQLTEQVRRQPYSVVLFDEFEKAHSDVFNILLQVLDEGWLTDGEGQKVSFSNCVIVGTSNIGAEVMTSRRAPIGIGAQMTEWSQDDICKEMFKIVKNYFRPEFLNRLDEIIIFNRLDKTQFYNILEISIADLKRRLTEVGIEIEFEDEAKKTLIESIETEGFGARPLKRKLEQLVENEIATQIIRSHSEPRRKVIVSSDKSGKIVVDFR